VRRRRKLRGQVRIVGDLELTEVVALGRDHTGNGKHLRHVYFVVPLVEGVVLTLDRIAKDNESILSHVPTL
jgi:hypothetical protein